MKIRIILLTAFLCMLSISCLDDKEKTDILELGEATGNLKTELSVDCPKYIAENKSNNLNISILLDLSDRIIDEKTVEKDTAYLGSIARAFTSHIKSKKLILLQDRMQLFFNPEPTNGKINKIANELQIQFTRNSAKEQIRLTEEVYKSKPIELYHAAKENATKTEDFPGSDIWRFFKDDIKDYAISDCHRNLLIILTDGYMYYDKSVINENGRTSFITPTSLKSLNLKNPNWKRKMEEKELGFLKATNQLDDVEVLVLGVRSENPENPYAIDILKLYWEEWLMEMGVDANSFKIKEADIASSVDKVIRDFILK